MTDDPQQSVLDAVPMPVLVIGPEARIAAANVRAAAVFGGALVGRSYLAFFRQPPLVEALDAVRSDGRQRQARAELGVAGGGTARFLVTASSLAASPGEAPRSDAMLVFEEVGEREDVDAMRRDFVANVSHELRSPLASLSGFIETLRGAARHDTEVRDRFLATMETEVARMIRLVRDLLSLSRVEVEERRRPAERIDLMVPLRAALGALKPLAEAENVALVLEADDAAKGPVLALADADQMAQLFTNLLENAIKYGGRGKQVTVRVARLAHDPALRGPATRIEVADQGPGIDPVHIPRLTERFYRIDAHRSRALGGTGLGLAIVKHIVGRHRGRMRIDSASGQGSRFIVVLPAA